MLEIRNLSKSYGEKKAVCNLNLIVEDGDIMGFIGKNGAGKTTTLKSCLGIVGIDKGEILLDGVSILKEPIVCKKKMAYVPDNPQLDEYMTGIQYLKLVVLNTHAPVKYIRVKIFPVPVGLFGKGKPRCMGGGFCFLDKLRGKSVVVGFDKSGNVICAVFVVVAHSGGQLVKAHILA